MSQEFVKSDIRYRIFPRVATRNVGSPFRDVTINCLLCSISFVVELAQGCFVEMRRGADEIRNESVIAFQEVRGRIGDHILEDVICPRCGVFQYLRFDNPVGLEEGDFHSR